MSKWKMVRLGDVCDLIRNGANIKQVSEQKGYPITRIETISNRMVDRSRFGYANITSLDKYKSYLLQEGDILMSHINSTPHLGKTAICKLNFDEFIIHGMNLLMLRTSKDLYSKYANFFFSSLSFLSQIARITKKSVNQASFTIADLSKIILPLPPLETQKEIALTLDKASELINLRKKQLEELDLLAEAVFYDMFGDPVKNEKGWKIGRIADVAPVKASKNKVTAINDKYWLLNLDMIESNTGFIINKVYKSKEEIGPSVIAFDENHVLYSKLRPYLNKVVSPKESGYATTELVPLCPNKQILNKLFLNSLLRSHSFVSYIQDKVSGAKMPRVCMDSFKGFNVILPPLELQNKFATIIEKIEEQKVQVKKALQESEDLFQKLMQDLFNPN